MRTQEFPQLPCAPEEFLQPVCRPPTLSEVPFGSERQMHVTNPTTLPNEVQVDAVDSEKVPCGKNGKWHCGTGQLWSQMLF